MDTERELVPVPVKRRVEDKQNKIREYPVEKDYEQPREMPKRWYVY